MTVTSDRVASGARCINWLHNRLEFFSPWRGDELSMEGLQACAELAVLVGRLADQQADWERRGYDIAPAVEAWKSHILAQIDQPEFATLARKRPLYAFPYLLPYLAIRRLGVVREDLDRSVEILTEWGFPWLQEVTPFRELDAAYFLARSGVPGCGNLDLLDPFSRTSLARTRYLSFADVDLAYSVTHTVLYLTDFGRDPQGIPPEHVEKCREGLASFLVQFTRAGHLDLVGESLLCSRILGNADPELADAVEDWYDQCHIFNGACCGRIQTREAVSAAVAIGDDAEVFARCYHTTLVTLLLVNQQVGSGAAG